MLDLNKEKEFKELQKKVNDIYHNSDKNKLNKNSILIGVLLLLIYISSIYLFWNFQNNKILYLLTISFLGIITVSIVLVIGHESTHNNFTNNHKINRIAESVFYFLGTSPYFWKLRHINSHHPYTNIKSKDLDIEQSKIIRLSNSQKFNIIHKYQQYYMPFLFLLYTLNWFFIRDFTDIRKKNYGKKKIKTHPKSKIFWLLIAKLWHFLFLIIIPIIFGQNIEFAVIGFFTFHLSASIITTLILVSTHIGIEHELIDCDINNKRSYSWSEHQIITTGSFSIKSKFLLHFFGGFNHHLAHHLFPNIPYVLYPKVTPLIEKYCQSNNLIFICYPNIISSIKSHFIRLKYYSNYNK